MSTMEPRELERLRYRHGQTIRGLDFRDQRRIEDQLRAWHNRALHNVFGVAKKILGGLKATFKQGYFLVESGMAYDCFGRPLLRCEETNVPFGQQTEPMYLVIRQKRDGGGCQSVDAPASCFPQHHSLIAEDTELVWLPKKNFSFRDGVPIARTTIVSGVIHNDETFIAPAARALARPRISSGTTIPGATTWEVSDLSNTGMPELTEVRVRIDTSSAGFASIPEYFAFLQGPLTTIESPRKIGILCLHFDHVERMRADGFVFSFFILVFKIDTSELTKQIQKFLNQQKAYVSWIGFERNPGDGFFSA